MNNTPHASIQELWQHQPVEGIKMSVDEIQSRARKFERRISRRNLREYAAGGTAIVAFGYFMARAHGALAHIAFGLLIAGPLFVMYQLHRKGGSRAASATEAGAQCVQFFRSELERQRDLISNVWSWYLGPLIPGLVMLTVASAWANPHPASLAGLVIGDLVTAAVFIFIAKLNSRAARALQRQIDELRAVEETR